MVARCAAIPVDESTGSKSSLPKLGVAGVRNIMDLLVVTS